MLPLVQAAMYQWCFARENTVTFSVARTIPIANTQKTYKDT